MHLTVIGAPGTGKTSYIEKLIKERGNSDFLYLTYNKAMAIVAEKRLGSDGKVATFHSEMSKRNGLNNFLSRTEIIDFAKSIGLTFPQNGHGIDKENGKTNIERFLLWYDLTIQTMVQPYQPMNETLNLRYIKKEYEAYKEELGKLDYTDVIRIGAENTYTVGDLYIDEAQDLTPLMWKIVDNFQAKNVTIAGDPHQSIYSYKGVMVKEFQKRMDTENIKILDTSHRYGDNLRKLSELALGNGRVMNVPYAGSGNTEIDHYSLENMSKLEGTKAILCRTNALARYLAVNLPYAVVNIKKDNSYPNGWHETTFQVAKIMKKWPDINSSEFSYIVNHSPANMWVRGTQAKVKRKELTLFNYDLMKKKMGASELITHMNLDEKVKKNAIRLLKDDIPIIYCDTIHAAKGLEYDHVMLITDIPKSIEDDFNKEEHRILYVGMTRAKKSMNFQNIGFYKGTYDIPGYSKTLNTSISLVYL
jgi:ATP-dependent exoDNAse (exonuclease V) beta subunit